MKIAQTVLLGSALIASFLLSVSLPASASVIADARATSAPTTAAWSVMAAQRAAAPTSDPLELSWLNSKGTPTALLDLVNVGTLDTLRQTLNLTSYSGNGHPLPTMTFEACVDGEWTLESCSGAPVFLGEVVNGEFVPAVSIPAGGRLSLRVTNNGSNGNKLQTTVTVSVSRTQVRPAVVHP